MEVFPTVSETQLMSISNRRLVRSILVIVAVLLIGSRTALAIDLVPEPLTPTAIPGLVRPLPTECIIEPLPMTFFEPYMRDGDNVVTPPAYAGLPIGTPRAQEQTAVTPTVGPPADFFQSSVDLATDKAVDATFYDYIACFNASDPRRSFALFTTSYLNEFLNGGSEPLGIDDLEWIAASPIPRPLDNLIGFVPSGIAFQSANDRICDFYLVVDWPYLDEPRVITVCFVFERGRYRIDRLG